jgi:hypothetical protein
MSERIAIIQHRRDKGGDYRSNPSGSALAYPYRANAYDLHSTQDQCAHDISQAYLGITNDMHHIESGFVVKQPEAIDMLTKLSLLKIFHVFPCLHGLCISRD